MANVILHLYFLYDYGNDSHTARNDSHGANAQWEVNGSQCNLIVASFINFLQQQITMAYAGDQEYGEYFISPNGNQLQYISMTIGIYEFAEPQTTVDLYDHERSCQQMLAHVASEEFISEIVNIIRPHYDN